MTATILIRAMKMFGARYCHLVEIDGKTREEYGLDWTGALVSLLGKGTLSEGDEIPRYPIVKLFGVSFPYGEIWLYEQVEARALESSM